MKKYLFFLILTSVLSFDVYGEEKAISVYYWTPREKNTKNFGDDFSRVIVEKISNHKVPTFCANIVKDSSVQEKKVLALGSILHLAKEGDVVWGSGINGNNLSKKDYHFKHLDIRAVRGPLTRKFLIENLNQECPEIYGDPCQLIPYLFPEFKKASNPSRPYIIIPHISEIKLFPKDIFDHVILPTQPWREVLEAILDTELVISSSLHGIILAEAFGVPARMLRVTKNEPLFKYQDYYFATGRYSVKYATTVEEALMMQGEPFYFCNYIEELYKAFPFDLWPDIEFFNPFTNDG